ncbi:hypothetical protein ACFQ61_08150 [Streptomyces sp. NPDC056500]|uniref:hypothetical protein n=1 Tax=Streptomyces sp. NPDC056500 TaxID=3345840 RepID=UPI0036C7F3B1
MDDLAAGECFYRDREGQPLDLMEWARLYENHDYRCVSETEHQGVLVRTSWEGLDAGVIGAGSMFHTGVRRDGRWTPVWAAPYPCTLIEAEAAHELIAAQVRQDRSTY